MCYFSRRLVPLEGADYAQRFKKNHKKITFNYIDDVFSLINSKFGDFVDLIYSNEPEIIYILVGLFHTLTHSKKLTVKAHWNKGNNKITELRTILQRESQNS